VQGSGGGRTCKDVIDAFVSERADFDGLCKGHCGPIVRHGCQVFSWGRTLNPNNWGGYHYTLNWGNCDTTKCDDHCDSVAGTDDGCFASGIDTPGCGTTVVPTIISTKIPTVAPKACSKKKGYMSIKIQTDKKVKKDKTKWGVFLRKKKGNTFSWKRVGKLRHLKNDMNTVVFDGKCMVKSKCYMIQVSEKKKSKSPGMDGYLKVIFNGITKEVSNWTTLEAAVTVGKCS